MRKHWLFVSPFLALACVLAAPSAAQAREGTMNPFVKAEHYLGDGRSQVTLEQFAVDPASYLRPGAYTALRQHIANQIGVDSLSDVELKALLNSNKVKVVPCEGEVITGGLRTNGTVGKLFRGCYAGELKVLVQDVDGNWKPGFLLGCLNPDYTAVVTVTVTVNVLQPGQPIYMPMQPQPRTLQTYRPGYTVGGQTFYDCCCDNRGYTTSIITIPGSTSTQTLFF